MLERFLEYIAVEKRYSPHTLTSYRKDLEDFSTFLLQTEGNNDVTKVDKKIIRNFMVHLSEKKISKRSINRKLSSLRSFYLFLLKVGEIKISPLENIQSLKFYAEKQIPFSEEEMDHHQSVVGKSENQGLLKELIIEALYQTGIRR
ncbi:MAG: site-specific integrase, partial [Chryseobacterium sp.]|nr:site-specific integrase [Chryseobacterium sp.]